MGRPMRLFAAAELVLFHWQLLFH